MNEDEKNFRILVLLSLQRALIGMITPNMLAVYVSWTETEVFVRVLFDGTVSPDDIDWVSIIETEIIADIPTHAVRCVAESCFCAKNEMPKPRVNERIVFKRAINCSAYFSDGSYVIRDNNTAADCKKFLK